MPYTVGAGGILELRFVGKLFDQRVMTVLHYKNRVSLDDGRLAAAEAIASAQADDAVYDRWIKCLSQDVTNVQIHGQWIHSVRYAYIVVVPGIAAGQILQPSLPPNTAQVITKKAEEAGRRNIGACHLPGLPTTSQDAGSITALHLGVMQEFANTLPLTLDVGFTELDPVILHRPDYTLSPIIFEGVAQDTIRVERRRTVGLGI